MPGLKIPDSMSLVRGGPVHRLQGRLGLLADDGLPTMRCGLLVVARDTPAGEKAVRIEFEELTALLSEYGARMRCGLDNARLAPEQQINCLDPAARAVKYGAAPKQ